MKLTATFLFLAATAGFAQGPLAVNEFPTANNVAGAFSAPIAITQGPDGNLWYTDSDSDPNSAVGEYPIGVVTTGGKVTQFDIPAVLQGGVLSPNYAVSITTGSDGSLWFGTGYGIGSVTKGGAFGKQYPTSGPVQWVTLGHDGNIWFTEQQATPTIGFITPRGALTELTPPVGFDSIPNQIVAGWDGALWWADNNGFIGRVTTSGQFSKFVLPAPYTGGGATSTVSAIAAGPDGAVWFTGNALNLPSPLPEDVTFVGKLTMSGQFTIYNDPNYNGGATTYITAGPDGAMWISDTSGGIGRVTLNGVFSEYTSATVGQADQLTTGPDGSIWFTDFANGAIGQATLPYSMTCLAGPGTQSLTYTGQCTAYNGTAPYTYSVTGGSLPPGLTLNSSSGTISGTITGAGTFNATVQAKDSHGATTTQPITIVAVPPSALSITCSFPGSPQEGVAYSGGCSASGGTSPYTYSVSSGSLPPGLTLNASTGAVSGTPSKAGSFTFAIEVKDSESPAVSASQTATLTVGAPKLVLTCSIPAGLGFGLPVANAGCTATFGKAPYQYSISAGSLPTGVTLDKNSGALLGAPTTLGGYTFTVQATDSSSPVETATSQQTVTVQIGAGGGVTFTINGVPQVATPMQNITGLTLQLSEAAGVSLPATLSLQFADDAGILNYPGTATTLTDPAMQFVSSSNAPLGLTYNFTIPATGTSVTLPNIDPGTVAGAITINLTVGTANIAQAVATIPGNSFPIVEPGSVQITNVSSSGFDVELNGISPDRELDYVTFTFNAAPNAQLLGTTSFNYKVTDLMNTWYTSTSSAKYGSEFSLTMPFQFNGQISAIQSVTVTLTSGSGTSTGVTGTR